MGDVIHTSPQRRRCATHFRTPSLDGWSRSAGLSCYVRRALRRGPRSPGRPLVDWVHVVRLTGWRKSLFEMPTIEQIARVWNDVRSVHYQVAVDLQGAIRSAVLARMSRAPVIYGARQTRESPASFFILARKLPRAPM